MHNGLFIYVPMKNLSRYLLFFLIFCLFSQKNFSQSKLFFSENKGQWHENVLFKTSVGNTSLFLEKNAFTFDMNNVEHHHIKDDSLKHIEKQNFKGHAYQMIFEKANEQVKIKGKNPAKDYENYFIGNDKKKWTNHVKRYPTVFYENIYKNIDLQIYSQGINFKYDFIVKPHANINDIQLIYKGLDKIYIEKGNLILKTCVGELTELAPYTYQIIDGDTIMIKSQFHLQKNKLTFKLQENYNKNYPLIIDPVLIACTFNGATSFNSSSCSTFDNDGNIYLAGFIGSPNYPVTVGAYDVIFTDGTDTDVTISKFDSSGENLLFATYLGGHTHNDIPGNLIVNAQNELYVYGTTSASDFPVTSNSYDQTFGNSVDSRTDIYISRFSEDGSDLLASTYIGGNQSDGSNRYNDLSYYPSMYVRGELMIDQDENIYLASHTFSTNLNFNNAYQSNLNGELDGLLVKLNPNLSDVLWGTYFGGNNLDVLYSVDIDSNNDVYVCGATFSTNALENTAYDDSHNGSADGFICKFSQDGDLLKSTYFGSDTYDQAYFVRVDDADNVYITGQTNGSGLDLLYNADYYNDNGSQFIAKFTPDLENLIYSTVFGSGASHPNIVHTGFMIDNCNRPCLVGFGATFSNMVGSNGLDITANAIQTTTNGTSLYIMVLTNDASALAYGTFFSNYVFIRGTSRFDRNGIIYQNLIGDPSIATPNAWSLIGGSAVMKMNLELDFITADFNTLFESSNEVHFHNTSLGTSFIWDFGDGSSLSYEENPNHIFTETGVYEVQLTVIDNGSCNLYDTFIKEVEITYVEAEPTTFEVLYVKDNTCYESCDGKIIVRMENAQGYVNIYAIALGSGSNIIHPDNMGNNTFVFEDLCAKNYRISAHDNNNDFVEFVEITQPAPIFNMIEKQNITCFGQNDGNMTVSTISGEAPYTYVLNNNDTLINTNLNNLSAGIYNLQVIDNNNCKVNEMIEITEPDELTLETNDFNLSCFGDSVNIISNILGGTAPFEISWKNENNETFFSDNSQVFLKKGNYQIFINDANNCKDTVQFTLTETLALSALEIELINKIDNNCGNACIGEATFLASGGGGNYTYVWNNGFYGNHQNELCTGNYTVTVIDENNCTNSLDIEIKEDSLLNFEIADKQNISCYNLENGSFNVEILNGLEPFTYTLNNINIPNITNINNLSAGEYHLKITDINNCYSVDTITITEPEILDFEVDILQEVACFGEEASIEINANGGTPDYQYFLNDLEIESNFIDTLKAGNYIFKVKDENDCELSKDFEIIQPEILNTEIANIQHNLCFGDSIGLIELDVSGGTLPYNFLWNNSDTTIFSDSLKLGIYTVNILDENNCQNNLTVEITEPNELIFENIETQNITCFGENNGHISVNLNGGVLPYNYFLNDINFQNESFMNNLSFGTYNLQVFDENNCHISQEIILEQPEILEIESIENIELNCFGTSVSISLNVNGGTPEYHYFLNNLNNEVNVTNDLFSGNYTFFITDKNNCIDSINFEIIEADSFYLAKNIVNNPCFNDALGSISLDVFGGKSPYNFLWNNGNTTNYINNLQANTYHCLVTDINNCEINTDIEISQPTELILEIDKKELTCFGVNDAFINVQVHGGTRNYTYIWNDDISENNLADNLSEGIYNLTVSDENNCQKESEIIISPPPEAIIPVLNQLDNILCYGDSANIEITTTGGISPYKYFFSDTLDFFKEKLNQGNYEVIITDKNNCQKVFNFTVNSPSLLILDTEIKKATCKNACNGKLDLKTSGGTEPYFYFINENSVNNSIDSLCLGAYKILVKDANNCEIEKDLEITFFKDTLKLNIFPEKDTIYKGEELQFYSEIKGNFKTILWDNIETLNSYSIPNPIAKPIKSIEYTAILIDFDDCGYKDKFKIFVKDLVCDEPYIFVPNAFSPNNDGKNDILYVQSDVVEEIYFAIYNRWGNLLFETNDIKKGWDGKFNGEYVESSVLVYYVQITCLNKQTLKKKGNITIIR